MLNKLNWFLTTALLLAVIYLMSVVTHVAKVSHQNSIFIANNAKTNEPLENNFSWGNLAKDHSSKSSRIVENEKSPSEVYYQDTKEINTNKVDNSVINFSAYTFESINILNKRARKSRFTSILPDSPKTSTIATLLKVENSSNLIKVVKDRPIKSCFIKAEVSKKADLIQLEPKELICEIGDEIKNYQINGAKKTYPTKLVSPQELAKEYENNKEFQEFLNSMPEDTRRPYEAYVKEEITSHNALRIPKNTKIQGQFFLVKENRLIDK